MFDRFSRLDVTLDRPSRSRGLGRKEALPEHKVALDMIMPSVRMQSGRVSAMSCSEGPILVSSLQETLSIQPRRRERKVEATCLLTPHSPKASTSQNPSSFALRLPVNGFDLQLEAASKAVLTTTICTQPPIGLSSDNSQDGAVPVRLWQPSQSLVSLYIGTKVRLRRLMIGMAPTDIANTSINQHYRNITQHV